MSYGTWLVTLLASTVAGVDAELVQRLAPLWRQIAEAVALFFGPRGVAGCGPGLRA